jgi:hypothetical protein
MGWQLAERRMRQVGDQLGDDSRLHLVRQGGTRVAHGGRRRHHHQPVEAARGLPLLDRLRNTARELPLLLAVREPRPTHRAAESRIASTRHVGWVKRSADPILGQSRSSVASPLTLDPTLVCRHGDPIGR